MSANAMNATRTTMLCAALLAGLYGIGTRKSAIEGAEVAAIPSSGSNRGKGATH
ncbi:hypothetical protein [Hyphomicrobium sp. NDB2Meth4]|uniref:hypothetical protein n=1 Tax=Hyphomicrobium sp. NDB2Meth4 TaxID=1892846 RepID=UPI000B095A3B|nr:hypothetical protein [Hyphomicrobium sp. NDB2Meth4]